MSTDRLRQILQQLREAKFSDIKGARFALSIPIGERLLNELVRAALPPTAPVRDVAVAPRAANVLQVRARVAKIDFLPPLSLTLDIDQQPQLPDTPLGLRLRLFPGLTAMAGSFLNPSAMPPGIRLEGDRLYVDIRHLLQRAGYEDVVPLIERLRVSSEEGRLILELDARVG